MNLKNEIKKSISLADSAMGRFVYKNTNEFSKNFKGNYDVRINQITSRRKKSHNFNDVVEKFIKHGCAFITEYVPKDIISDIAEQHKIYIEDPSKYNLRSDHVLESGDARRTIYDAHLHIKELKYLIQGDIKEIIEDCYNSYFDIMRVVTHRNYYVDDEHYERGIYSNKWHCDARRPSVYKIMLNLSDVTSEDGPFHILTKSRTSEMLKLGFIDRHNYGESSDYIEDVENMERLIGPKGTAMICNTNECLHKAGRVEKGHCRDLLMIQFVPSNKKITDDWIKSKSFDVR
jgi:ectoine hydroxylase-related dioxygenase (phytanoyl-CoA dioxygenase family)